MHHAPNHANAFYWNNKIIIIIIIQQHFHVCVFVRSIVNSLSQQQPRSTRDHSNVWLPAAKSPIWTACVRACAEQRFTANSDHKRSLYCSKFLSQTSESLSMSLSTTSSHSTSSMPRTNPWESAPPHWLLLLLPHQQK